MQGLTLRLCRLPVPRKVVSWHREAQLLGALLLPLCSRRVPPPVHLFVLLQGAMRAQHRGAAASLHRRGSEVASADRARLHSLS